MIVLVILRIHLRLHRRRRHHGRLHHHRYQTPQITYSRSRSRVEN